MQDSAIRWATLRPGALAVRTWQAEQRPVYRKDPRWCLQRLVGSVHGAKVQTPQVSQPPSKKEERRPEPGNSFQNRQDPTPGRSAFWPSPASSKHQALPRQLSFCRGKKLHVRNRRNSTPEKGSIPNNGPFAALSSSQFPDPTAVRGNPENALETDFRTLPGLDSHASIRETRFHHSFPMPRKTPAPHPTAGTSFPVFLSVRAAQRKSLDSGKRATPETQEFASTDPIPRQLRNQLRTPVDCHPA